MGRDLGEFLFKLAKILKFLLEIAFIHQDPLFNSPHFFNSFADTHDRDTCQ